MMNYSIVTALFCLICHSYTNSPFLVAAQKARSSSISRLCGHEEVELTDENWRQTLSGKWMIKFYAPWCPACQSMDEDWVKLARKLRHHGYCAGSVNVAENAGLSGRFLVTSLPTVYHAIDGKFRLYDGVRATDEFEKFIVESKWSEVKPVAWYLSPTSYHMAALGSFFTFSMFLKDVHVMLTDDFGLPNYLSYAMFAIVTILIGLIIGLLLVFCCDIVFSQSSVDKAASTRALHKKYDDREISPDVTAEDDEGDIDAMNVDDEEEEEDDVDDDVDDDDAGGGEDVGDKTSDDAAAAAVAAAADDDYDAGGGDIDDDRNAAVDVGDGDEEEEDGDGESGDFEGRGKRGKKMKKKPAKAN